MKHLYFVMLLAGLLGSSCKKEEGEGGNSSIRGKIMARDYTPNFSTLLKEYPGADVRVYIVYGDDETHSDDIRSSYDGMFEFKGLKRGKYSLYVYSVDSTGTSPSGLVPVIKTVEITDKRQTVDAGTFTIIPEE